MIRQEKEAKLEVLKNHASVLKEEGNSSHKGQSEDAMETYRKVRSCARSLYTALSRGWHCECAAPHHANLRLEARRPSNSNPAGDLDESGNQEENGGDQDLRFKFLFSYATGQDHKEKGKLKEDENIENIEHQPQKPLDWREAEIARLVFDPEFTLTAASTPQDDDDGRSVEASSALAQEDQ